MKKYLVLLSLLVISLQGFSQSEAYQKKKAEKLSKKSPFEKIVDRELPATILYEDKEIIAFIPLRPQAPVHILVVPKKRIPTMNDISKKDAKLVGRLFVVAKQLAKEKGIAETGYRLTFNTNEDSGQSVFHIHLHLIGGKNLGPMVSQDYREEKEKKKE